MKSIQGRIVIGILLICGSIFSQGCGKDEPAAAASGSGSCSLTVSSITTCYDLTGSAYAAAAAQTTTCSTTISGGITSTHSASACATTGRIGSCVILSGANQQTIRYLTGYNSTTAQAHCTASSGTYTAD